MRKQPIVDSLIPVLIGVVGAITVWFVTKNPWVSLGGGGATYLAFFFFFLWIKKENEAEAHKETLAIAERASSPEGKIESLRTMVDELNCLLEGINVNKVREQLTLIYKNLDSMVDYLNGEPKKVTRLKVLLTDSLPTLLKATSHFSKKAKYNLLADDEISRFTKYLLYNQNGFVEMFRKLLEQEERDIEFDKVVSMSLLKSSGFDKDSTPQLATRQ